MLCWCPALHIAHIARGAMYAPPATEPFTRTDQQIPLGGAESLIDALSRISCTLDVLHIFCQAGMWFGATGTERPSAFPRAKGFPALRASAIRPKSGCGFLKRRSAYGTWPGCPATGWRPCPATGEASTAFGSISSGASASNGRKELTAPQTLRSLITIKES